MFPPGFMVGFVVVIALFRKIAWTSVKSTWNARACAREHVEPETSQPVGQKGRQNVESSYK